MDQPSDQFLGKGRMVEQRDQIGEHVVVGVEQAVDGVLTQIQARRLHGRWPLRPRPRSAAAVSTRLTVRRMRWASAGVASTLLPTSASAVPLMTAPKHQGKGDRIGGHEGSLLLEVG